MKTAALPTNLNRFSLVNKAYSKFFKEPFPASACYEVNALPQGAKIELKAVISLA
ncbi:Rid family hydrolase [Burkholderia ubonensis]|uniref:Rid family hydrolase n=1 Tax=Burkholderia ubonensis TaxID=101571 RepID=UPI002AB00D80|nr:Rid family hydrolase [Burkholderia ubonensis]